MSWDISIQHLPEGAMTLDDIPDDFQPGPLGPRPQVIASILREVPDVDFSDPTWGMLRRPTFSIEFNMGTGEICDGFMLHVRGGDDAMHFIEGMLKGLGLRGVDCQSGDIFTLDAAQETFGDWQCHRDRIISGAATDDVPVHSLPAPSPLENLPATTLAIFSNPFVTRTYPCPSTGRELTVHVKEMLLTDYPMHFRRDHGDQVYEAGGALFSAGVFGMRPWRKGEITACHERHGKMPNSYPWEEVWYAPRAASQEVFDLLKFTSFYDASSMDRYDEFRAIVDDLDARFGVRVLGASNGGVGISLIHKPGKNEWIEIVDRMLAFNEKHFTVSSSKKTYLREAGKKLLTYGHC